MLAVIVCSLFNAFMLAGLLAGIGVGFWRARAAIGGALAVDPDDVRALPVAERPARWQPV